RLMASWGMLADLCFADLLLFVPSRPDGSQFVVMGQMRPTSTQTLHWDDLVGRVIEEADRPLVARSWRLGEIVEGEVLVSPREEQARVQCIPVRSKDGEVLAVLSRESAFTVRRSPGELERVYLDTFVRFAKMIVNGGFPFDVEDSSTEESPRVGDGVLVLDAGRRVEYASPNAVNALHRMGIHSNAEGMRLDELGTDETSVVEAFATAQPVTVDVERGNDVIVLLRCLPLIDKSQVTGALVLLRDISDLRRRDRLLLSKDTTIREIHHRVKNNLQTISSLLRLQARRLSDGEGKAALDEAERRIRSIALVHEILSRDVGEQVEFNEIVKQLVRMAEEALPSPDRPVRFRLVGDAGELAAEVATPLAVVLTELLQNAAEHAFPTEGGVHPADASVEVGLENDGEVLRVRVHDNGVGLPPGFSVDDTTSLGLSIVRHLITSQLEGTIEMHDDHGTVVDLCVGLEAPS
ncbi:MAG TPA: sensor histidine kinase, partial [Acidimicrobiales bacterium]|nr:sensor histidine kinase [Acidimicrobiales bacterium]